MTLEEILKQVSADLRLSEEEVSKSYKSYWKFIKSHIEILHISDTYLIDPTSLQTCFNIPMLGKLNVNKNKVKHILQKQKSNV